MPPSGVRGFSPSALNAALSRKRAGNQDLADAVGVSRQSVVAWQAGKSIPTAVMLHRVARWLDVAVADLVPIADDRLRISDLRIRTGMNQRSAAAELQIGHTALAEIERGRRQVSDEVVDRMVTVYGVEEGEIRDAWDRANAARKAHIDSF